MKVLGMITEYNPFHKGHLYHLEKSLEISGCDTSIAVMSGNFVQRGEPAIFNKFYRAARAVDMGVNLVLELPLAFSLAPAEIFTYGGIQTLHLTNLVDVISFGSESADLEYLSTCASSLLQEDLYRHSLKEYLSKGYSYAKAKENSVKEALGVQLPKNPNDILGIWYLAHLMKLNSSIKPILIKRMGSGYLEKSINSEYPSATAIRARIKQGECGSSLLPYPLDCTKEKPIFSEDFFDMILYSLMTRDVKRIYGFSEGLHHRLQQGAAKASSYEELLQLCTSKRYSLPRVQRAFMATLLGIREEMRILHNTFYLHPLAFDEKGRTLLNRMKKKSELPFYKEYTNDPALMLAKSLDDFASNLYGLKCGGKRHENKVKKVYYKK